MPRAYYEVIVSGAGVLGAALVVHHLAAAEQREVLLLGRNDAGRGTTAAAAGFIATRAVANTSAWKDEELTSEHYAVGFYRRPTQDGQDLAPGLEGAWDGTSECECGVAHGHGRSVAETPLGIEPTLSTLKPFRPDRYDLSLRSEQDVLAAMASAEGGDWKLDSVAAEAAMAEP